MLLQVYKPYLLMNKKRYAGLLWTNSEKYDKMDTKVCSSAQVSSMHNINTYGCCNFLECFSCQYETVWVTSCYVQARPPDVVGKTSAGWCRRRP